ncbi:SDR family NAD(P)-dependent oxidoreductase [Hydrocarboniphaga effusa]|jgi:NAD(P)-dependent dehydrogenase (short-subunit alcohol dehydrogenase family)|uniref:SDR family NAD(P)-dependent oxidoreductase n=1 Tax=Hydrocarboniphaga effusa TaxID=243629 RepID=UPI0031378E51
MATRPSILITGAAGDIGRATALRFAGKGYRVAVCDVRESAANETTETIRAAGGLADAYAADVGDSASVAELFERLKRDYGRLDAAFNNAGRGGGRTPLDESDDALWDDCIRVNLTGTYYCMKQEIKLMLAQGGGVIVNNSSLWGLHGGPSATYTASKHGIVGLTKSAALSYAGKNIRINAVCPGLIDGGLGLKVLSQAPEFVSGVVGRVPMGRPGTVDDVAAAVAYLCSDEAAYITGHSMAIDGGCGSV